MSLESGPSFLKNKYNLHASEEVARAATRTHKQTGEKVLNKPSELIDNYLNRFKEILDRPDPLDRQQGIDALKQLLLNKFVTKFEDIPDSYWQSQENIIRDRGQQGDYNNYSTEQKNSWKKEISQGLLEDQKASLEQWIDYLSSPDSSYMQDYLKYWTFRSVTNLAEYDKDKQEFPDRSKGTVKMFPDINHEALAYVIDAVVKKHQGEDFSWDNFEADLSDEQKKQFTTSLNNQNFAKLYAWANEQIHPIAKHLLPVTEGKWIKYERDNEDSQNYKLLNQSIRGKGTGWCTAGENTAMKQLQFGDFYCFYSNDDDGQPTIPRIAIRMQAGKIAEVRGIATKQNLDPYMGDVLNQKLQEFPDKDEYLKKEHDMSQLTQIYNKCFKEDKQTKEKVYLNPKLDKDELTFIYELDSKIEGFGYVEDPRVKEIKETRNLREDAPIICDCQPEQIVYNQEEYEQAIRDKKIIKVYIGPLFTNIFTNNIEHIYTSFPEGKIEQVEMTIGTNTKEEIINELNDVCREEGVFLSEITKYMLNSYDFTIVKEPVMVNLVHIKAGDIITSNDITIEMIYRQAKELGLELCPPEVGPLLRLSYKEVFYSEDNSLIIGMKPIGDSKDNLNVFYRSLHTDGKCWLGEKDARPDSVCYSEDEFVFCVRKLEAEEDEETEFRPRRASLWLKGKTKKRHR